MQPYLNQSNSTKANSTKDQDTLQSSNLQSILDAVKGRLEAKLESKVLTTNGSTPASPMVQPSNGNGIEEGQLNNSYEGSRDALREFLR